MKTVLTVAQLKAFLARLAGTASLAALIFLISVSSAAPPAHAQPTAPSATRQPLALLRATELRADKLAAAPVLRSLAAGTAVRLQSLEGGWALVELTGLADQTDRAGPATLTGWVRASSLNLPSAASIASTLATGREAIAPITPGTAATAGNTQGSVLTLGVRSLPSRVNRHALIIGISRYADPATPPLPGARVDRESATQMAQAMQVPASNIRYLQDEQATGNNIRQALKELNDRVLDGDRVFIHYSGHGTRFNDPAAGGCVEALLAHDGVPGVSIAAGNSAADSRGTITNREMADLLKTITHKTDKLFVMYDACHSGGLVQAASTVRTRGFANSNDEGLLRPKFSSISEECARPVNVKTRNLLVESTARGVLPQDIIHVSASRDNELSFDDEIKGGLATQFMRDCMLRDAKDLDNSGAISMDEIRVCAQQKINQRMANDANYKPHNLVLNGNAGFVPAWFSQPSLNQPSAVPVAVPTVPAATLSTHALAATGLTGEQALRQMFDQRDAKRSVRVIPAKDRLRIGQDALDFSVQSDRAGFVYVALAGSDNKSVYLLFPNELDQNNKIEAGQPVLLPRPNWRVTTAGPPGSNSLLVMVADGPRDLRALAASKAGPFMASLNDAQGRATLGALMTNSQALSSQACASTAARRSNVQCSDAYGASMFAVEELR